jgi:hypothetical protein
MVRVSRSVRDALLRLRRGGLHTATADSILTKAKAKAKAQTQAPGQKQAQAPPQPQPQPHPVLSLQDPLMMRLIRNTSRSVNQQRQLAVSLVADELPRRYVEESIRDTLAKQDWAVFFIIFLTFFFFFTINLKGCKRIRQGTVAVVSSVDSYGVDGWASRRKVFIYPFYLFIYLFINLFIYLLIYLLKCAHIRSSFYLVTCSLLLLLLSLL